MSVLAVVPSPATFPAPIRAIVATVDASVPEYDGFIGWVLGLMDSLGEVGVGLAVLMETFVPPIPSEAVLPGAGFLAYDGRMNAWLAWLAATLGALVGAWMWYGIGAALGRARTRRFVDRIPLMDGEDFDKAEAFLPSGAGSRCSLADACPWCVPLCPSLRVLNG